VLDPSRPLNRLQDRVALITGAASGIGRATAILFASEGARVAASDRTLERLSSLARELEQSDARGHLMVAGDVTSGLDVRRVVQETTSKLGPVDILCNIAGVLDRALLAHELPDEVWARVLGVNLTAPFLFAREVLGSMLERNSGVIICISSGAGLGGGRAGTAYTVAKHGVIGLGRSLAAAYGQAGIRSVVICPGAVTQPTGSVEGPVSSLGAAMIARRATTRPRDATPEQIARVILFAASDEASHVNGATLTVDGGWSAI
jgi:NAD(P)-dependent dehydrogenase (short-subunit alcohol dehydrogenase family)